MGSEERTITVRFGRVADEYERVHFVHHYLYNPNLTTENIKPVANLIADQIFYDTGYMAFVRDIKIKHYPPFMSDVDFVVDSPAASPIAALTIIAILKAIALILAAIAALGIIVLLFVTIWSEKFQVYVCEQCPEYPSFTGWAVYMGHLKEKHPEKYKGAVEAGATDWWTKPVAAVGGLLLLGLALVLLPRVIPERRKE